MLVTTWLLLTQADVCCCLTCNQDAAKHLSDVSKRQYPATDHDKKQALHVLSGLAAKRMQLMVSMASDSSKATYHAAYEVD